MTLGRPREYDTEKALDEAMEVFWRHGYEGATIAELTSAMGINPPSLYSAFGSKEGLLKAALDRYSLAGKRPVTVALLKQWLAERTRQGS